MGYLIVFIVGIIFGSIIMQLRIQSKSSTGLMVINESDPDFATCGFNFDEDILTMKNKNYIVLKIKSQK